MALPGIAIRFIPVVQFHIKLGADGFIHDSLQAACGAFDIDAFKVLLDFGDGSFAVFRHILQNVQNESDGF
jgi:hypothetical protein